mgnify:CR=1 FL=1
MTAQVGFFSMMSQKGGRRGLGNLDAYKTRSTTMKWSLQLKNRAIRAGKKELARSGSSV